MERQNAILVQYKQAYPEHSTFKEISAHTGIQMTRVFRLFNSFKMHLHEYLRFEELVKLAAGKEKSLFDLLDECVAMLSYESVSEIERLMERRLQIKKYQLRMRNPFKNPNHMTQF